VDHALNVGDAEWIGLDTHVGPRRRHGAKGEEGLPEVDAYVEERAVAERLESPEQRAHPGLGRFAQSSIDERDSEDGVTDADVCGPERPWQRKPSKERMVQRSHGVSGARGKRVALDARWISAV
jgi:hypothetical protein